MDEKGLVTERIEIRKVAIRDTPAEPFVTETPQELGRPRRRFYQLTAVGARTAKAGIRDFASTIGELAWRRR